MTKNDSETGDGADNGNGSIMRIAPIPILYHDNLELGEKIAYLQSLTTHNGDEAAEICRFFTHLMIKMINFESDNIK